jgi:hypothetical protein
LLRPLRMESAKALAERSAAVKVIGTRHGETHAS